MANAIYYVVLGGPLQRTSLMLRLVYTMPRLVSFVSGIVTEACYSVVVSGLAHFVFVSMSLS